ncbi:MAG: hypothetical protein HFE39_02455 [Clostridiales bacterium]|jgi:uncharacterized membrane protein|nr:hypothetical protein [Clostridiales bacterium]
MNQEHSKVNITLLSVLAYIGPLFIMGRVAVEKDVPEVEFHSRQGGILFAFTAIGYLITAILCFALRSLPAAAEIVGLLLYVGITVAWVILSLMGIVGVIKHQQKPLPFIGDFDKLFQK